VFPMAIMVLFFLSPDLNVTSDASVDSTWTRLKMGLPSAKWSFSKYSTWDCSAEFVPQMITVNIMTTAVLNKSAIVDFFI